MFVIRGREKRCRAAIIADVMVSDSQSCYSSICPQYTSNDIGNSGLSIRGVGKLERKIQGC